MSGRVALPNHWSEAWVGVELGLALSASGREGQAVAYLQRSVVAAGEFDHPMTSIALLELGRLAMIRSDFPTALKYFEEASYAAVAYPDPGVLEEAFRYGALAHLMSNQKGVFPPLTSAIQWAKVKHLRQLHASLLLLAAENYAVLGQTGQTAGLLDDARVSIGRRDMGNGRIGTAEFPRRAVPLPTEEDSRWRQGRRRHHGLHEARLVLVVPNRSGRHTGHDQRHAAHGDGPLPGSVAQLPHRPIGRAIPWNRWPCWSCPIPCRLNIGLKRRRLARTTRRP